MIDHDERIGHESTGSWTMRNPGKIRSKNVLPRKNSSRFIGERDQREITRELDPLRTDRPAKISAAQRHILPGTEATSSPLLKITNWQNQEPELYPAAGDGNLKLVGAPRHEEARGFRSPRRSMAAPRRRRAPSPRPICRHRRRQHHLAAQDRKDLPDPTRAQTEESRLDEIRARK